ncbi:hypothetical protein B0H13DRAFT_1918612 [Mycena leptocephala]|nr:hypothetical protein B0H13DRAFT_1918612 [Mycena leptocephala]
MKMKNRFAEQRWKDDKTSWKLVNEWDVRRQNVDNREGAVGGRRRVGERVLENNDVPEGSARAMLFRQNGGYRFVGVELVIEVLRVGGAVGAGDENREGRVGDGGVSEVGFETLGAVDGAFGEVAHRSGIVVDGTQGGFHVEPGVEAPPVAPGIHDDFGLDINVLKGLSVGGGGGRREGKRDHKRTRVYRGAEEEDMGGKKWWEAKQGK